MALTPLPARRQALSRRPETYSSIANQSVRTRRLPHIRTVASRAPGDSKPGQISSAQIGAALIAIRWANKDLAALIRLCVNSASRTLRRFDLSGSTSLSILNCRMTDSFHDDHCESSCSDWLTGKWNDSCRLAQRAPWAEPQIDPPLEITSPERIKNDVYHLICFGITSNDLYLYFRLVFHILGATTVVFHFFVFRPSAFNFQKQSCGESFLQIGWSPSSQRRLRLSAA